MATRKQARTGRVSRAETIARARAADDESARVESARGARVTGSRDAGEDEPESTDVALNPRRVPDMTYLRGGG